MSAATPHRPIDPAIIAAQDREDVAIGNEIVRHSRTSRLIHWTVSAFFFLSLLTGMPIWTPIFGWMAALFGGLSVCRVLHPWLGVAFFLSMGVMFLHWLGDMRNTGSERGWSIQDTLRYMRYESDESNTGKYNGGQKLFFFAVSLGAVGLLLSGLLMWFPSYFPNVLRELAYLIHDFTFIAFAVAIVAHIYLGTAAEPGTFGSMIRGTVTRPWARLHHGRWYREVTGNTLDDRPRR
ncbi:MAG: formate dehydrogenase subunit gamma [Acidobacteriota bacterium]|nr:formate dehydrogenase subunit gamma [Acidobacteriota bacterium]